MPFARDLHPEFGYVGSAPRVLRRIGLVLSFLVFGVVAGASGVAVFLATPDSDPATNADPLHALALAPSVALIDPKTALPQAQTRLPDPASAQKADKERSRIGSIRAQCRETGECAPVRVIKVRPPQPLNERPAIATVPIGHRDDPAVLPPPPSSTVPPAPAVPASKPEATPAPTQARVAEVKPADPAPAAEPAPAPAAPPVAARKPRTRISHAQPQAVQASHVRRRSEYSYSSSSSYGSHSNTYLQGGFARVW